MAYPRDARIFFIDHPNAMHSKQPSCHTFAFLEHQNLCISIIQKGFNFLETESLGPLYLGFASGPHWGTSFPGPLALRCASLHTSITTVSDYFHRVSECLQLSGMWSRSRRLGLCESRMVCCRSVQLMPTLFLKLTKIWERENGKFVDFSDLTQV